MSRLKDFLNFKDEKSKKRGFYLEKKARYVFSSTLGGFTANLLLVDADKADIKDFTEYVFDFLGHYEVKNIYIRSRGSVENRARMRVILSIMPFQWIVKHPEGHDMSLYKYPLEKANIKLIRVEA